MIAILELNGNLIHTLSGMTYPQGVYDMQFDFDVLNRVKDGVDGGYITKVYVVSNEGGIACGKVSQEYFDTKIKYITTCVSEYCNVPTFNIYCPSMQSDYRFPNVGMLKSIVNIDGVGRHLFVYSTEDARCAGLKMGFNVMSHDTFVRK